jgi:hypothetical protein
MEFEREMEETNLKALGFDKAEGMGELCPPEDCSMLVAKVGEGSSAG